MPELIPTWSNGSNMKRSSLPLCLLLFAWQMAGGSLAHADEVLKGESKGRASRCVTALADKVMDAPGSGPA